MGRPSKEQVDAILERIDAQQYDGESIELLAAEVRALREELETHERFTTDLLERARLRDVELQKRDAEIDDLRAQLASERQGAAAVETLLEVFSELARASRKDSDS